MVEHSPQIPRKRGKSHKQTSDNPPPDGSSCVSTEAVWMLGWEATEDSPVHIGHWKACNQPRNKNKEDRNVSSWILTSCQSHRTISGRRNNVKKSLHIFHFINKLSLNTNRYGKSPDRLGTLSRLVFFWEMTQFSVGKLQAETMRWLTRPPYTHPHTPPHHPTPAQLCIYCFVLVLSKHVFSYIRLKHIRHIQQPSY